MSRSNIGRQLDPRGITAADRDRFWSKVRKTENCWWFGRGLGYGVLCLRYRQLRAHRIAFAIATETTIPAGMCICHHCDHPGCVRPDHLFLGTNGDNMRDKAKKNHARQRASWLRYVEMRDAAKAAKAMAA